MTDSLPSVSPRSLSSPKRKSSAADLTDKPHRPTKRRASKACQCCRSRKVRCNVVEHGPPCTNCRLDEVECIVTESKRKRRSLPKVEEEESHGFPGAAAQLQDAQQRRLSSGILDGIANLQTLPSQPNGRSSSFGEHIPHSLYRTHSDRFSKGEATDRPSISASNSAPDVHNWSTISNNDPDVSRLIHDVTGAQKIPSFLKPIPTRMGPEEVEYLEKKGALSIPDVWLRNELCRSYIEFVHPYMPLINIHEFLEIMTKGDGSIGRISLLLFQGIMFAGSAFVDLSSLQKAGFTSRKDARKVYFQRVRHLYDFDYEIDRFAQVQTLLLMTSWYETSDDKKDAWHWMGIAIATAYTIGLHRNPARSNMEPAQQRQWKRVWWACIIRDRLIALGARRPIRIKAEDCDVPMLSLADFDFGVLSEDIHIVPADCRVVRDVQTQTNLASMCIEKAKLCLCISDVLTSQYSIQKPGTATPGFDMRTAAILSPKAVDPESSTVSSCQENLEAWFNRLPEELHLSAGVAPGGSVTRANAPAIVQRAILHLIYYATLSALHRPQVLHNAPSSNHPGEDDTNRMSRDKLRNAALKTTKVAKALLDLDLVQYLPTTGVSVLQPAIISHLLDIKSPDDDTRRTALQGFCQCIKVLEKLRDCYTAADHSIALVEAAIRRADIKIPVQVSTPESTGSSGDSTTYTEKLAENAEDLVDAGRRENLVPAPSPKIQTATPPPEHSKGMNVVYGMDSQPAVGSLSLPTDFDIARKLEVFLASTPLEAEPQGVPGVDYLTCIPVGHYTYDADFDSFVNFSGGHDTTMDEFSGNGDGDGDGEGDGQGDDVGAHFVAHQGMSMPSYSQYPSPSQGMVLFNDVNAMTSPGDFDNTAKIEGLADFGASPDMSIAVPS